MNSQVDPSKIMQIGMGFWASKIMLTAINLELFTHLSNTELSGAQIQQKLRLHSRGVYDFLDALVSLGFLNRTGIKESAMYSNANDVDVFLDKKKPSYIGGILEMANSRLYGFWNDLETCLKTGEPQNETKGGGASIFEILYSDQAKLKEFLAAMGGVQMGNFIAFSKMFDFTNYTTHCDVGGAGGFLAMQIAANNPHMQCVSFDLPPVEPIANQNIAMMNLTDKVSTKSGDFFKDELPNADLITMGNVLHDWGVDDKKLLIKKAYNALPVGGALAVIENIIDDERRKNVFGLMMSLNMQIETPEGFDFSAADFDVWAKECGFKETSKIHLTGPASAVIAFK